MFYCFYVISAIAIHEEEESPWESEREKNYHGNQEGMISINN